MSNSILWISKSADELRSERDLALRYLAKIAEADPERGFINRRALAIEALERISNPAKAGASEEQR